MEPFRQLYVVNLVQDCSISSVLALTRNRRFAVGSIEQ